MTDTRVAVVAHTGKTFGGGLDELRKLLFDAGIADPLWFEVDKSRKAPKKARRALDEGAGRVLVWGGDGMVQRCADAVAGSGTPIAIVPAVAVIRDIWLYIYRRLTQIAVEAELAAERPVVSEVTQE